MSLIPEEYFKSPICNIYIKEKLGLPFLTITKEKVSLLSCTVNLDAKGADTADIQVIAFPDTVDLELSGVHEGETIFIEMGYDDTTIPLPPKLPFLKDVVFIGKLDRPTVRHGADGNIIISLKAKALVHGAMNTAKVTRDFIPFLPRIAILSLVLAPYLLDFPSQIILFESMVKLETTLKQVNVTDFGFVKILAQRWGLIFHQTKVGGLVGGIVIVDDNDVGRALINSLKLQPLGYIMHWRAGRKNLKSITFSGATAAKKSKFVLPSKESTGPPAKSFPLAEKVIIEEGEDDAGTWILDEDKIADYIKANGINSATTFLTIPNDEGIRSAFYTERSDNVSDASKRQGEGPKMPGMGKLGHKAEYVLAQGDVNLESNMGVYIGGEVMSRFKSDFVDSLELVPKGKPYRALKVIHKYGSNGYQTSGTIGR